jgi:hypothetical protein
MGLFGDEAGVGFNHGITPSVQCRCEATPTRNAFPLRRAATSRGRTGRTALEVYEIRH